MAATNEEIILRSLNDGWDYMPNWRHRVIESYIAQCLISSDPKLPSTILDTERDPYVRQAFRYRMGLVAVNGNAIEFTYRTQRENKRTGLASMIKAMVIADRRVDEIAAELHLARENVVAYTRMFFDVERYLGVEVWLQSIVLPSEADGRDTAEAVRERRWMAIALYDGWPGLEAALFKRTPPTLEGIKETRIAIQSALSARALEYARTVQASGTAPTHEDLSRYVMVADANTQKVDDKGAMATAFARALLGIVGDDGEERAKDSDNPDVAPVQAVNIRSGCLEVPRYRKRA